MRFFFKNFARIYFTISVIFIGNTSCVYVMQNILACFLLPSRILYHYVSDRNEIEIEFQRHHWMFISSWITSMITMMDEYLFCAILTFTTFADNVQRFVFRRQRWIEFITWWNTFTFRRHLKSAFSKRTCMWSIVVFHMQWKYGDRHFVIYNWHAMEQIKLNFSVIFFVASLMNRFSNAFWTHKDN